MNMYAWRRVRLTSFTLDFELCLHSVVVPMHHHRVVGVRVEMYVWRCMHAGRHVELYSPRLLWTLSCACTVLCPLCTIIQLLVYVWNFAFSSSSAA